MRFVIPGQFVPYVRMTRRGKYVSDRAQRYLNSQQVLAWWFNSQMTENGWGMIARTPIAVDITIQMTGGLHRQDLDNQVKAILDAANGIVWSDDRWVDSLTARRILGDVDQVVVVVEQVEA